MIEFLIAVLAFIGCGIGNGEDPSKMTLQSDDQQIIRAIDSNELKGLNNLEAYNADQWYV